MTPVAREKFLRQLVAEDFGKDVQEVRLYLIDRALDDLLRCGFLTSLRKKKR